MTTKCVVRWIGVAALATLAACGEDGAGPPDEPLVARVVITPSRLIHPFSLDTVRVSAAAYNADGQLLDDVTLSWSSTNGTVATVDQNGLIYTLGAGQAEITARVEGTVGAVQLSVDPGLPLENTCMRCHTTQNPASHIGWGFPAAACTYCHVTDAEPHDEIIPGGHPNASGGFELLGAHAAFDCTTCHEPGTGIVFPGNPAGDEDCIACHQSDYSAVHPSGWPTVCLDCHTTDSWARGPLDHEVASGGFRLLGAHTALDCNSCHDPDTWAPYWQPANDADCIACHQSDYSTVHPAGWPATCLTCHTRDAWQPPDFDHDADYFPIFSGTHDNRWGSCQACHTDVNDYKVFTCFTCHLQPQTDGIHTNVPAYQYVSTSCLGCHPDGVAPPPGNGPAYRRGGD
jgi:hypothetical protein